MLSGSSGEKNNEHQSSPQEAQKTSKDQRSTDEKHRQRLQWTVLFVEHSASLCCKEAFVPLAPCLSHGRRITKEKQRKQTEQLTLPVNPHIFDAAPKWQQTATHVQNEENSSMF